MQRFDLRKNSRLHISIESKGSVGETLMSRGDKQFMNREYLQAEQSYHTALQSLTAKTASSIDRAIIMKSISAACRMQDKLVEALRLNALTEQLLHDKRQALESLILRPPTSELLSGKPQEIERFAKGYAASFLTDFVLGVVLLSLASFNLLLMQTPVSNR